MGKLPDWFIERYREEFESNKRITIFTQGKLSDYTKEELMALFCYLKEENEKLSKRLLQIEESKIQLMKAVI